jgi:hypothetical protein
LAQAGDFALSLLSALTLGFSAITGIFAGPLTPQKGFANQLSTLTEYFFPYRFGIADRRVI